MFRFECTLYKVDQKFQFWTFEIGLYLTILKGLLKFGFETTTFLECVLQLFSDFPIANYIWCNIANLNDFASDKFQYFMKLRIRLKHQMITFRSPTKWGLYSEFQTHRKRKQWLKSWSNKSLALSSKESFIVMQNEALFREKLVKKNLKRRWKSNQILDFAYISDISWASLLWHIGRLCHPTNDTIRKYQSRQFPEVSTSSRIKPSKFFFGKYINILEAKSTLFF